MSLSYLHQRSVRTCFSAALLGLALLGTTGVSHAQVAAQTTTQPLTLTLEEALQIALAQNYALRSLRLDVDNAEAQIRQTWGQVLPQVNASSSYTRNLKSANPFAGSGAGSIFQSLGSSEWLVFNEQARTDDDPSTSPISLSEYFERRNAGMEEAGVPVSGGGNPFGVPNQFSAGITVEQSLFDGSAFAAIKGAERLRALNERAVDREEQLLIDQVRQAYYAALLAQEQADVAVQSVARIQQTVEEVSKQVAQGVAPKFNRLSSEVELVNLETQLVQIENQADLSLNNLKLTLGIPIEQPIVLRGDLEAEDRGEYLTVSTNQAVDVALENRPDLEQARLAIELREIDRAVTRAEYLPTVSAVLGLNYSGNVPDNRWQTFNPNPDDPFQFERERIGFFSQDYWNPSLNVGLRLSWNIFNGFQTSALVQQRQIAVEKARIDAEQLLQAVYLEVDQALKNLNTAQQRIMAQEQNVANAELSYQYAVARLGEGVASQLEEREASEQLDQSRLNHLQAVYDYLVAKSAFETAIGAPVPGDGILRLTSNE
jgi:outer membrane protein TolC